METPINRTEYGQQINLIGIEYPHMQAIIDTHAEKVDERFQGTSEMINNVPHFIAQNIEKYIPIYGAEKVLELLEVADMYFEYGAVEIEDVQAKLDEIGAIDYWFGQGVSNWIIYTQRGGIE